MTTCNLAVPARALAIGAHPDDVEIACGGTLAKWTAAGCDVHVLVLTDGSKGTWSPDEDVDRLVEIRRDEARSAAHELGVDTVHFLEHVDGELVADLDGRGEVCEVIRTVRPDTVLGHDPWKRYRLHPDHRAAGWLTVDGIVAARDPHFFPRRGGDPFRPTRLLLFEADEANHIEDVAGTVGVQCHALLAHRSQWLSTLDIDLARGDEPTEIAAFERRIEERARRAGEPFGHGPAEPFALLADL